MTKHVWRKANLLRPDDIGRFDEAALKATQMGQREWTFWLNRTKGYNYAFICKLAKHVGLCTPGHAFYPRMRAAGIKLKNQEDDSDILWSQK